MTQLDTTRQSYRQLYLRISVSVFITEKFLCKKENFCQRYTEINFNRKFSSSRYYFCMKFHFLLFNSMWYLTWKHFLSWEIVCRNLYCRKSLNCFSYILILISAGRFHILKLFLWGYFSYFCYLYRRNISPYLVYSLKFVSVKYCKFLSEVFLLSKHSTADVWIWPIYGCRINILQKYFNEMFAYPCACATPPKCM